MRKININNIYYTSDVAVCGRCGGGVVRIYTDADNCITRDRCKGCGRMWEERVVADGNYSAQKRETTWNS
jgi:hypothetical protein